MFITQQAQIEEMLKLKSMKLDASVQATSNSNKALVVSDHCCQIFTGTVSGQLVTLPDATTLDNGHSFELWNLSTKPVVIRSYGTTVLYRLSPSQRVILRLSSNSTQNGVWANDFQAFGRGASYVSVTGASTNNSQSVFQTKATLTLQNIAAGWYLFFYSLRTAPANANRSVNIRMWLDSTTSVFEDIYYYSNSSEKSVSTGFFIVDNLSEGNHTIEAQYMVGPGSGTTITASQCYLMGMRFS